MSLARGLLPPVASGGLFGAGLTLSGMTDPGRVRGFLDLFGAWDPTLAFVMAGAVAVMALAWRIRARMATPWFGDIRCPIAATSIPGSLPGPLCSALAGGWLACARARHSPRSRFRPWPSCRSSQHSSQEWL